MIEEDDYLLISGIQHFVFCRRQWALIHIESQWHDNSFTASGQLMHEAAHDPFYTEKRGDLIIARSMPVFSHTLEVRGVCDIVEFHRDENGVSLFGRDGLWLPSPVEYKSGNAKTHDADRLQLCAQVMCLEEMLVCPEIRTAHLYYGKTKRREAVQISADLRETVRKMLLEMRGYYDRLYTPRVKPTKACTSCSLKDQCLPKLPQESRVAAYIKNALTEDESSCGNY